jgi:two-component system, cell cycle response regulator
MSHIPPKEQESLLHFLDSLLATVDEAALQDGVLCKSLVDAIADHGHLLLVIQRQAAELDALKRITRNLTTSLELQAVLDAIVQEAMQLVIDAQDAHIFLFHDGKLTFGASLFSDGRKNVPFGEPRPDGLTATVARKREIVVVNDMHSSPLYASAPNRWAGSIIGIPLIVGDRVVGVMNLARTQVGSFSPSEVRLLTLLADQATIAITNARLHRAVSYQARSDMLTGLPNRRALDERLGEEIARSNSSGTPFSVIMMDLDGFKIINDTYGHDVGDVVLRKVADLLKQTVRTNDFLARYGGDELTLILSETDLAHAQIVVGKIRERLSAFPIPLPDGKTTIVGVSGGIALYPRHAETAAGLLRAADEALYRAKKNSRGNFVVMQNNH